MIDETFEDIDQLERLFATEGDDDEGLQNPTQETKTFYGAGPDDSYVSAAIHRDAEKSKNKTGETTSFRAKPSAATKPEKKIDSFFEKTSVYTDPVFGMRIVNPLISSTVLLERMEGRSPISFARIRYHTDHGDRSKDWVLAGAIISKFTRESQKGQKYTLWKLSDLRNDMKTVSVFLFKSAHSELWKTPEGTVVGVLNPGIMERKDEKADQAVLSVDNPQKVMIMGQSKDLGRCRSKKKNGEPCTALVNKTDCEYCVYHVKQEYSGASRRSELQSATAGRGLNELRNKVLGKNEVFYAGQSFTAVPAKKNPKLVAKDQHRLMTLSEYYQSPNAGSNTTTTSTTRTAVAKANTVQPAQSKIVKVNAEQHESNIKQRQKDLQRLAQLRGESENNPPQEAAPNSLPGSSTTSAAFEPKFSAKLSQVAAPKLSQAPKLSGGSFTVDLSMSSRQAQRAKLRAIEMLKKKPIEKVDPNMVRHRGTESGKKRALDELNKSLEDTDTKRIKLEEDTARRERLLAIMNAKSSHQNLVDLKLQEQQDKYFSLLEKKEAMEEKMLTTMKMECKAVICLKCKYAALSAAERCKAEGHPLKVRDAIKRFFKCKDCGNRTITLQRLPKLPCKSCNGSRWEKTTMIKEKNVKVGEQLSIRGDEEMYIGNVQGSCNLNLLVPEEEG